MKKQLLLTLSTLLFFACGNDDDTAPPTIDTYDYNENLLGDLSNDYDAPSVLPFVIGYNTITASQSSADVDYFTFTVPVGGELYEIKLDDYQSTDDAGFIGVVSAAAFPNNALSTSANDLLGGFVYGISHRGNDILSEMGKLDGSQGFTGALQAGSYSIWLNQTGATSETSLNFKIRNVN